MKDWAKDAKGIKQELGEITDRREGKVSDEVSDNSDKSVKDIISDIKYAFYQMQEIVCDNLPEVSDDMDDWLKEDVENTLENYSQAGKDFEKNISLLTRAIEDND